MNIRVRQDQITTLNRINEKEVARGVVATLATNLVLKNGDYLTEDDIEIERNFMKDYQFRYPQKRG